MEKQIFIETIEAIRLQEQHDVKCAKAINEVYDAFEANLNYKNHWLQNALLRLLQVEFKDGENGHSWIEYYLWETNFGELDKKVSINGKPFELKTASDLYDLLMIFKTED